jgi:hypothetical protein
MTYIKRHDTKEVRMTRQRRWCMILTALFVLTLSASSLQAAFDKGGVLGVGARPLGMGNAYVAVADDGDAMHWNVAGLIQVPRMELNAFIGPLLNGKEYYMAGGFVLPFLEQTAVGLSLVSLYHNTGNKETEAYENSYMLGFATPLNVEKTVSVGTNIKFLQYASQATAKYHDASGQEQTIQAQASALGLDLGFLYQVPLPQFGKKVNFGFSAQDLDTVLHWQSGAEERVPMMLNAGIAYWIEEHIVLAGDVSFLNDTNISGKPLDRPLYDGQGNTVTSLEPVQWRPHLGVEGWFFNDHLAMRTGYTGFATTAGRFTGGVSYRDVDYGVDYAYIGHAEHLGDSHRISGHIMFGENNQKVRVVSLVQPPVNLKAAPSNNSISLSWQPNPDPNVTGYTIYMSKAPGTGYTAIQKRIKDTQVAIDGLTNGTRYYFAVTSVNNSWPAVESSYSVEVSSVPAPLIPGVPSLGERSTPAQQPQSAGAVALKGWAPPMGAISGYNLYMSKTSGSGYIKVNTKPITETSYMVGNLEIGQRYYFILTSLSKDTPPVESRPSPELSRVADQAPQTPNPASVPVPK